MVTVKLPVAYSNPMFYRVSLHQPPLPVLATVAMTGDTDYRGRAIQAKFRQCIKESVRTGRKGRIASSKFDPALAYQYAK